MNNIGSYEYVDHDYDAKVSSPLRASALARQRVQAMRMPTPDDGRLRQIPDDGRAQPTPDDNIPPGIRPAIPPGIMPGQPSMHLAKLPQPKQPPDPMNVYQSPRRSLGPIMAIGAGPDGLGHEPPPPEPPPGPGSALVGGGLSLPIIVGGVLVASVLAGLFAPKIVGFKPNRRRRRR